MIECGVGDCLVFVYVVGVGFECGGEVDVVCFVVWCCGIGDV